MKKILNYTYLPKRIIDLVGAVVLLIILSPVMLLLTLLVPLESHGPIFFKQKRLTKDGQLFTMYKFRTMVNDAELGLGAVWAVRGDGRITRLGRILRRTRLDELPQLFNVIYGDMSLIGPRPERPEFAERLTHLLPLFQKRLSVKAGLTGLAQTRIGYSGSLHHYRQKVKLDSIYIDNCCLFLDLRIALRTVLVVLTGMGAR